ncbi:uncharacterized protein [Gossypium hirsutum]|uniref:Uncharacterized protein isoform X1 n=1 Tax=Gossypium hirsutum TaxID=3635 RepID=A0ABM3AQH8_GOSHI|nr:uncharacterized protein LOC107944767 isoform X1 [Gossypium hirsutum]
MSFTIGTTSTGFWVLRILLSLSRILLVGALGTWFPRRNTSIPLMMTALFLVVLLIACCSLLLLVVSCSSTLGAIGWGLQGATSDIEDAKEQIVQESKNSTLPSQDEKNPFVPGREIPPNAQDQIQRFYHRMFCLLGMKIWFRLIRKMKNFRTVRFVLRDMKEPLIKLLFWRLAIWITDDVLLQITGRGQGSLQCLSLVDCQRITDEGLKRVVENNPKLIKPCFQ